MARPGYVTVGRLSSAAGVLPSTVRFYVKAGLLKAVDHTPGGYLLFDMKPALERIERIRDLQQHHRLTLAEIREQLSEEGV